MRLFEMLKQHSKLAEPADPDQPYTCEDMVLYLKNRILEDSASCHDQQVNNNETLYMLLKDEKSGDFEDLVKVSGQEFEYEFPTKSGEVVRAKDD